MKPPLDHSPGGSRGICCDLAAFGVVRLPLESLPDIRRNPEPALGFALQASLFKHLDEQTVAGVAAVCRAIRDHGLNLAGFRDWGVLAAPYFLGQSTMVASLLRFRAEGAWGVSPHVIPHHSLHSVSGTISQVLKVHGPNLGVGGGTSGPGEALLGAAAWLARRRVPGVWVVLTTSDPIAALDEQGQPPPGTDCLGLALALVPARTDSAGLRLRIAPGTDARQTGHSLDLLRLQTALEQCRLARGAGGLVVCSGAPRVELEWGRPGRALPVPGRPHKAAEVHAAAPLSSGAETER